MIRISSICPLFFRITTDDVELKDIDYIQKFSISDPAIIIQSVDLPDTIITLDLINLTTGIVTPITGGTYVVNDVTSLYEFVLSGLGEGVYQVRLTKGVESLSSLPFMICSNIELLENTALISYTNGNNNTGFGAIFKLNDVQRTFYLRVEAGFKSSGAKFNVENEQFRTQRQDIVELYAVPYVIQTFTIGNSLGLPVCFGELINSALCLSDFRINGVGYRRSGDSTPQLQTIQERYYQYIFTVELERTENIIYNGYIEYPSTTITPTGVEIQAINPKDGEVLQYKKSTGAFVNSSKI